MKLSLLLASQLLVANVAIGADMPATTTTAAAPEAAQATESNPAEAPAATDSGSGMESVCTQSGNTRRVKVDLSEQKCQVLYYKETEKPGVEDKLWEYNHEFDKCKENYSNFVEKLRGMSWTCS